MLVVVLFGLTNSMHMWSYTLETDSMLGVTVCTSAVGGFFVVIRSLVVSIRGSDGIMMRKTSIRNGAGVKGHSIILV